MRGKHYSSTRVSHYENAQIALHKAQFEDTGNYSVQIMANGVKHKRKVKVVVTG